MSLLDLGDALEAEALANAEHTLRVFLNLKLREVDRALFESVPCPMAEYAELRVSDLPRVCREEASVWYQLQKKCIPAAERMLNDKALAPSRINVYPPMLARQASALRSQCEGAIEQMRTYPMLLEKWASFIERQKSPLRSEPHSLAQNVWSDVGGIRHYLGSTGAYEDFAQRIQKEYQALEELGRQLPPYVPPVVQTITLREPPAEEVGHDAFGGPLKVESVFDVRK